MTIDFGTWTFVSVLRWVLSALIPVGIIVYVFWVFAEANVRNVVEEKGCDKILARLLAWGLAKMPDLRSYRSFWFGAGLIFGAALITWLVWAFPSLMGSSPSVQSRPPHDQPKPATAGSPPSDASSMKDIHSLGSPAASYEGSPLAWSKEPEIWWEVGAGGYGTYNADAFTIHAKNIGQKEIKLDDIYIISKITGERKTMKVDDGQHGVSAAVSEINPIPPDAEFDVVAPFKEPGIPEQKFLDDWRIVDFVAEYEGQEHRITFDQKSIAAAFERLRPTYKVPPHVTKQQP